MIIIKFDFDQIIMDVREGKYRCIGSGSGRRVFDLENGYVVKVAKNQKGFAQNNAESEIASIDNTTLFARIPQVSDNYGMIIMQKAEQIYRISDVWKYYNVRSNRELFHQDELSNICSKYNLVQIDLCKSANWGIIARRPVIIDYGFTRLVKKKYYSPF